MGRKLICDRTILHGSNCEVLILAVIHLCLSDIALVESKVTHSAPAVVEDTADPCRVSNTDCNFGVGLVGVKQ
jgi:hypothetical protein